jgi:hypothetical protein
MAKVEWHPGELYPRVGFIVTNLARCAERIVAFYDQRGTCEKYIKEGKNAIKWTRLSCRTFAAHAVRSQLHALAYNLDNFMRTLAMPKTAVPWSLTSLREKLISAREDLQPRALRYLPDGRGRGATADVPGNPVADRPTAGISRASMNGTSGSRCNNDGRGAPPDAGRATRFSSSAWSTGSFARLPCTRRRFAVAQDARMDDPGLTITPNPEDVG